jgi:Amt family ammonium transporter
MGLISGSIPWCSMNLLGHRFFFRRVDDALGVVHTHMVAGFLGGFFTGIFATIDGCAAFGISNPGGAIDGNGRQVWVQVVGALFVIGWNLAVTPLILFFIKYVLRIPLKMKDEVLLIGDDAVHGEAAYTFEQMPLMERNGDIEEGTGSPMGSAEMQNRKNVDNERSHVRSEEVMA